MSMMPHLFLSDECDIDKVNSCMELILRTMENLIFNNEIFYCLSNISNLFYFSSTISNYIITGNHSHRCTLHAYISSSACRSS